MSTPTAPCARGAATLTATVAAVLALAAGCASGPTDQAGPQHSPPVTAGGSPTSTGQDGTGASHAQQDAGGTHPSAAAADVTVAATVEDGRVDPPPRRVDVEQGQTVRLEVSSDSHTHIHVHGYDLEGEASASQPAVITFTADQTGVFEVETHDPALQVVQLQVQ